jgi:hypothetical protein
MVDFVWCRQTRLKSMMNRRQALCSREPLATVFFLSLILVLFFMLPSILAQAATPRVAVFALVLAVLSAMTFIFWRHHRRDYASPRRNRRGI